MFLRILALGVFTWSSAETPRPRLGFEGLNLKLTAATATGQSAPADRSVGVEVTGNFTLTQVGAWRYDWGFRAAEVRHDWVAAPVDFTWVRGFSLNLSGYAATEAGRTRYAVLQLSADAASGASLDQALTVQTLYGADWKQSETFTVGYLFLAEKRSVSTPLVLIVPTFRWQFTPAWSLGTGRKSLVLERQLDDAWRATLALTFQQEQVRLADLGGLRQAYESERVAAVFGLRRTTPARQDELTVGWAFRARAERDLGGVVTAYDLAPGLLLSAASRWRF